ncbi:MAG: endopeptidase La [Bacilli bacterium]
MSNIIPVILLKELVILPNQEIKIELNNNLSKKIIKNASINNDNKLLVVAPLDKTEIEPSTDDLPKVGVIAVIKSKIQLSNGNLRVTLKGISRVAVKNYLVSPLDENILDSEILNIELPKYDETEEKATRRKLIESLNEYIASSSTISNSILKTLSDTDDLGMITDIITSFLPFNVTKKLEYMQNINPINRAIKLISDIKEEMKVIKIDLKIDDLVQDELEDSQKEYILREKIKAIKKELGEDSLQIEEASKFRAILNKLRLNKTTFEKINHEIDKYELLSESSPEIGVIRNYLDWVLNLPWNKVSKDVSNFSQVQKHLDDTHYGLKEIKTRIVEYVAIKNINKDIKSPIICLVGPPGVGKTSIAMSIAVSLSKKFYKISVGGLNDSTELIGSRKTYLGANPGKIIQGIKKCGTKNPVLLIDEVDKMVKDYKGDPASTLLEIIDPIQNKYFVDNYIEEQFDLSEVLFILTANYIQDIPDTILDRVEVINLNSYTLFEKKDIAKKYFLPRIIEEHKIISSKIKFTDELLYFIIKNYTREAGVRELERELSSLMRKLAINNVKVLNIERITKLLGTPKYPEDEEEIEGVGVVNSLAVTNFGGIVTKIESIKFKGSGIVTLTGSIGKVMEESVTVAINYLKSEYNISLNNVDLHLHFLDAATKKDGPSAGVSIAATIVSIFEKKVVPSTTAFTGEISLNGTIHRIGGLKEKLIGAYNKGINIVYIPDKNITDLEDVPKEILESIEVIPVKNFKEIYTKIFK